MAIAQAGLNPGCLGGNAFDYETVTGEIDYRKFLRDIKYGDDSELIRIAPTEWQNKVRKCPLPRIALIGGRAGGKTRCAVQLIVDKVENDAEYYKDKIPYFGQRPLYRVLILRQTTSQNQTILDHFEAEAGHMGKRIGWNYFKFNPEYGSVLVEFRYCRNKQDSMMYVGQEFGIIFFDEINFFADEEIPHRVFASARSTLPEFKTLQLFTANPEGRGMPWLSRRYLSNPRDKPFLDYGMPTIVFHSTVRDNPHIIVEDYIQLLLSICGGNRKLVEQWLEGIYTTPEDSFFGDVWDTDIHVIPQTPLPGLPITRNYDHGFSSPFATVYLAHCKGENITLRDGRTICPPRGSVIAIAEDYGSRREKVGYGFGLRMYPLDIGKRMFDFEKRVMRYNECSKIKAGAADDVIFKEGTTQTQIIIANEFKKASDGKIKFLEADKSSGSRSRRLVRCHNMLSAAATEDFEHPWLLVMANCKDLIQLLPQATTHPGDTDDIDPSSEFHNGDALTYGLTTKYQNQFFVKEGNLQFNTRGIVRARVMH